MPEFDWSSPPISDEDQRIIDSYVRVGVPVDSLAYTPDFERLCGMVIDGAIDDDRRNRIFTRLLNLRKKGVLPRVVGLRSY